MRDERKVGRMREGQGMRGAEKFDTVSFIFRSLCRRMGGKK